MPSQSFSDARYAALANKAAHGQWAASEVQAWAGKPQPAWWLPRKFHAAVVSQFYHGEMATIRMCRKLMDTVTDPAARRCVALQMADEERHAEVYRDYLREIGPLQPIEPILKAAYETALSWGDGGDGDGGAMMAAFSIILEAEALYALNYLGRWLRCPRFLRINARVSQDEARHLAFGRIYLKQNFEGLERHKRMEMYRRLKGLWRDTSSGLMKGFRIPNFLLRRRCRSWVETGWRDHQKALIAIGLISMDEARRLDGVAS
ncbi:MAG: ferritin-like domain-containing protein [Alphaproteobacteria bacterium]|nr:ferritin-like domain-containing protein [Alphaproteobacteria bacterium]